jgi:response regulator RpfG family c-di-GMP phosphodiesterase
MDVKVLCVDDDIDILEAYRDRLQSRFQVDIALGGEEGLRNVGVKGPYAVVVSDFSMPGMDGITFLGHVQKIAPDSVRIMLTGSAQPNTASNAINQASIFRFLPKPCPVDVLAASVEEGIQQYRLIIAERELLEKTLMGSISLLSDILSLTDESSYGWSEASQLLVRGLSKALKAENAWEIEIAAMLARIGMVAIPPIVLAKLAAGLPITEVEGDMIQHVPEIGSMLLSRIPRLENVARILLHQNQDFDGSGYPGTLQGDAIPLGSRVLRFLNDVVREKADTMVERTVAVMSKHPTRYDPAVIDAALMCFASGTGDPGSSPLVRKVHSIPFTEVRVGQRLCARIMAHDGTVLAAADQIISVPLLERLNNFSRLGVIKEPITVES